MKALSCRLIQFRNVEDRTFVPGEGLTVFTGPNGSGKTNVLEAFFLASIGRSLRTNQDQEADSDFPMRKGRSSFPMSPAGGKYH